jgi:hypothetical protein
MTDDQKLLEDLARVKVLFQSRAVQAAMGIEQNAVDAGDRNEPDEPPESD